MGFYRAPPPAPIVLPAVITQKTVDGYRRQYERAKAASERAAERRAALEPGSSRARITTANAKWGIAAEERDRCLARLEAAEAILRGEGQ